MSKKFLISNWKMNPVEVKKSKDIFNGIKDTAARSKKSEIIICPSYLHIPVLKGLYSGKKIKFGAQDCFYESISGSYTGEISPAMLAEFGVEYVIIGHSERRYLWESNKVVNAKVRAAISQGLNPIVCIGQKIRDNEGAFFTVLRKEIEQSLKGLNRNDLTKIIIAYEPLWAIGKSCKEAIDPEDLHTMKIFIHKVFSENYDRETALDIPVLYGGSVNSSNIKKLIDGDVDGFLVGRAGRDPEEVSEMLKALNK